MRWVWLAKQKLVEYWERVTTSVKVKRVQIRTRNIWTPYLDSFHSVQLISSKSLRWSNRLLSQFFFLPLILFQSLPTANTELLNYVILLTDKDFVKLLTFSQACYARQRSNGDIFWFVHCLLLSGWSII